MEKINKNAIVGDKVRSYALQALDDEIYDIDNGDFTRDEIAEAVVSVAMALVGRGLNRDLVMVPTPVSLVALCYDWKARSGNPRSWVSCSGTGSTGVSRCECPIFSNTLDICYDEVKMLVDMMNEAWFLMTNNG
jgi:hypothetical protein